MQKTVIVDASRMVYKLWEEYSGDLTQKKWIKAERKNILQTFLKLLEGLEIQHRQEMNLTLDNKEIHISFKWQERENIHYWNQEVRQDVTTINAHIWNIGLTSIVR